MADPDNPPAPLSAFVAATAAITATYVFFLLFAEFALLELFADTGSASGPLRQVMVVLGGGGLAGSLATGYLFRIDRFQRWLTAAFASCGVAGGLLLFAPAYLMKLAAVLAVGLSLGMLTVTLASGLRAALGARRLGGVIGIGTGFAYALCNIPPLFTASPRVQAGVAVAMVLASTITPRFLTPRVHLLPDVHAEVSWDVRRWIALFLVLVWFDSAAFYIIQQNDGLRGVTWQGDGRLWLNAVTHLVTAALVGWALDHGALRVATLAGLLGLVGACVILNYRTTGTGAAAFLYTTGVSCYSVALVYFPASRGRGVLTGLQFGVAGWIGSALGIGMAQDLGQVPLPFVGIAGIAGVALVAGFGRWRDLGRLAGAILLISFVVSPADASGVDPQILRGREVYISEGCIHCHSQYHRPGTTDTARWGPAQPLAETLAQDPPLIGNRRQGPDLARVGQRRTPEWNRLHLINPRAVIPGSRMPAYAHLFRRGVPAGDDLVAYLSSLGQSVDTSSRADVPEPSGSARSRNLAAAEQEAHALRNR